MPLIVLAMIIGVMIAKKYLNYVTPMYESTVKLRLADVGEGVPSSNLFKDLDVFASSNKIAAEIEILKSQVLITKVMEGLNFDMELYRVGQFKSSELYNNSPIRIKYELNTPKAYDKEYNVMVLNNDEYTLQLPNSMEALPGKMGDTLYTALGNFCITLNDSLLAKFPKLPIVDHYKFEICSASAMLNKIGKNLDITPVDKDVAVVRISFKHRDPEKAAIFTNRLAESYIEDYIEAKYKAANVTVSFLEKQIEAAIVKLTEAENNIESYRNDESITNITQETETDLRKISQLKIQQTNLKMNLEAISELEDYIKAGHNRFLELAPNFEAFTDLLSTEIIKKMKELQSERIDLMTVYTKEDDRVKVIEQKLKNLTSYLEESITNTRKNLETKFDNISNDIYEAEQVFITVPEKEKILHTLYREFNIYEKSYNFLNEKKIEAEIAQAAKIAFHRIISKAQISDKPVSPNRAIIVIVSALLALFGSLILVFIVHTLKAKVNDVDTIESNCSMPVVMLTPKLRTKEAIRKHFAKEAIELELKKIIPTKGIVSFNSYNKEEGNVFNALQLAKALATQGRKILILDVDNLTGKGKSFISPDAEEQLPVLSLTDKKFNEFSKASMKDFFAQYMDVYDLILVINEPLADPRKAMMFMSLADINLMVLDSRLTPRKRINEIELMKEEFSLDNMSFILNRFAYNPNVIIEIKNWIRSKIKKFSKN